VKPNLLPKQPWLITAEALQAIHAGLFETEPQIPPPPSAPCLSIDGGIGVIAIRGPMLRQPGIFERVILKACDTNEIIQAVEEATNRPDVEALFLDIDSPGGSVNGTPELAQTVADAAKSKYVYAFSAGQMCSAAYWVASQADAIYATPSARVGSIGVILPVIDSSAAYEQAGLKVEVFSSGKFKSAGTPGTSLTDDQRDWLQAEVEETAADFRAAVLARGRKIPDEAMEGQTFSARKAMRLNMAGVVANRAEALSRLRKLHVRSVDTVRSAMTAPSIENELAQAREQITRLESDASARESLLAEANTNQTTLQARLEALESERQIEAEALVAARADLETARGTHDSLTAEKDALNVRLKDIEARNAALEAAEHDLEKRAALRAAQIVAETGTPQPAAITPKGDDQSADLVDQFRAITDPKEQTVFWRGLSALQQAQILSTANQ
jgi:signal peptide peptidase SppA